MTLVLGIIFATWVGSVLALVVRIERNGLRIQALRAQNAVLREAVLELAEESCGFGVKERIIGILGKMEE